MTPKVTSGVRSQSKNSSVGGADKSRHIIENGGDARDVVFPGISQQEIAKIARQLGAGGVGFYKDGHIHLDTGPTRTWNG